MEQTAVEWFEQKLDDLGIEIPQSIFEQAKELEKQQITDAYWDGGQDIPLTEKSCEQYYQTKFNK